MKKQLTTLTLLLVMITGLSAHEVLIPHLTGTNTVWGSYLQVDNVTNTSQTFQVQLYNNGQALAPLEFTIDPLGTMLLDLSDLQPDGVCGKVTYNHANMKFRLSYESKLGGGLAEFALDEVTDLNLVFFFSDFSPIIEWKGIALTNLNSGPAQALIFALGDGEILAEKIITISPQTRIKGLYTEWFPGVSFADVKSIAVTSLNRELCGVAISGDSDSSKLLFTAAQPLSTAISDSGGGNQGEHDGTWRGVWTSTDFTDESGEVVMYLTEENDTFTGTADVYETDCGDVLGIPVTGTVQGNVYSFNMTHSCLGVTSTLQFTQATLTGGNHLSGTYTQLVDSVPYDHGTFYMDKDVIP